ncbi:MAG: hypothetical protein LAO21_08565 [Acidobacteriia bacterium]|nr:hypothetical protein [Terriglobia bacterium]
MANMKAPVGLRRHKNNLCERFLWHGPGMLTGQWIEAVWPYGQVKLRFAKKSALLHR